MAKFLNWRKPLSTPKALKSKNPNKRYKLAPNHLVMLTYLATVVLVGMLVGTFLVIILLAVISRELPSPNRLLERSYELSTKIFDRNNKPIFEVYGEKNRTLVELTEISNHLQNATLATEDSNFYQHKGFSLWGMLRAVRNTATGKGLQGGSTLTQQAIKNALLSQERTMTRKIKELVLSLQLENRYSKDEILQIYLNETPYGGQNYGVYTAAKAYFNKHPKDLTLAESAYLAGLPQRPSYYSQFGTNPEAGLERKSTVLQLMHERGWLGSDGNKYFISDAEYEQALAEELTFQSSSIPFQAPHFVFYVKQALIEKFGEDYVEQGGLQVTTSLDLDLQEKAQQIVYEEIDKATGLNVYNGAAVVLDPRNGQVLAMVGSKGYFLESEPEGCISGITGENSCLFEPQVNVALSNRQPGSAIKPITYATLLNQGYTAAFPFLDVPTKFPGSAVEKPYEPENYDGIFRGPFSLRRSLANSLNIPAVKALKLAGINEMIDLAEDMGISTFTDRDRYGLALTLGGGETKLLELTGAFGSFANKGKFYAPNPILEVKDSQGNVLYKWHDDGGNQAITEEVAFLISDILSDDGARSSAFGTGSLLNIPGYQVAVKTGTTDDKRDNYAIGYTPSVLVGTWVGNNNNEKMNPNVASGISGATPIWNRLIKEYLSKKEGAAADKFVAPQTVTKHEVDSLTGSLPYEDNSRRSEWFVKGTEPTSVSEWYQRIEVCDEDGKIANDSCKENGDTDTKTFIGMQAELPEWQPYVDKWISENYNDKEDYFPPKSKTCLQFDDDGDVEGNDVCVTILNYEDGDAVPLDFRLSVEVSSSNDIGEVRIYMDGNLITEDSSSPWGYNFELQPSSLGTHEFSAVAEDDDGNEGKADVKLEITGYQLD